MQLLEALGENFMQLLDAKSCIIGGLAKVAATFSGPKVAKCNFESCILQLSKVGFYRNYRKVADQKVAFCNF